MWSLVHAAREKIVGWYSTGPKLKEADLDISALMSKFTDGCAEPVLVICDVEVSAHPAALSCPALQCRVQWAPCPAHAVAVCLHMLGDALMK